MNYPFVLTTNVGRCRIIFFFCIFESVLLKRSGCAHAHISSCAHVLPERLSLYRFILRVARINKLNEAYDSTAFTQLHACIKWGR